MKKERLVIKNFGPIKSVDLTLGKMTVLIGDNATGKSTIAKVLSICRYFSYMYGSNEQGFSTFYLALKEHGIIDFLKLKLNKTEIFYENEDYTINFHIEKSDIVLENDEPIFQTARKVIPKTEKFKKLINELNLSNDNQNISLLDIDKLKNVMNNPLFIPIERIVQSISFNKDLLLSEVTQDQLRKLRRIAMSYNKPTQIPVLDLDFYTNNGLDFVKKQKDAEYLKLSQSASGWQSTTPIVLGIKYYNEIKPKSKTFIIEEPENNLFPKTQKQLVEFFVENINKHEHQFILPTHSPYILSAINNCLYAGHLSKMYNGSLNEELNNILNKENWLDINDLSVYYLENGESKDILNRTEGLIDIDDLDSVSRDINKTFDELLNLEMRNEA